MAARAQIDQVILQEFNFEDMESTADWSSAYVLIQSCRQQRPLIVTQHLFQVSNTNEHLQLRHCTPVMSCIGNLTSWDIRLYERMSRQIFFINAAKEALKHNHKNGNDFSH